MRVYQLSANTCNTQMPKPPQISVWSIQIFAMSLDRNFRHWHIRLYWDFYWKAHTMLFYNSETQPKKSIMKVNTIFQVRDNLGGRLLLAYDGADEDLTSFYIFYCNPRLSSFGFVTNKVRLCISSLSKSETNIINSICKLQFVIICSAFLSTQFFIQKSWHLSFTAVVHTVTCKLWPLVMFNF